MKKKKVKLETESAVGSFLKKLFRPVSDGLYGISVAIHQKMPQKQKTGTQKRVGELVFYCAVLLIPMIQFLIMYVGVNVNSFIFAFQSYAFDPNTGKEVIGWVGFDNFTRFWKELIGDNAMMTRLVNSLIVYAVHLFVGTVLAILFSYYIYKGYKGTGFFRVTLMMPSILSSVVLVLIYKYMLDRAIPALFNCPPLMSGTLQEKFWLVILYNTLMGFGSSVLMYSNAMTRIPQSLTEYAQLEGCSPVKEFFYITLPLAYPTIETFLIIGLSNLFIDQANMFTFYNEDAADGLQTIGYYLFTQVFNERSTMTSYPYASAAGLTLTAITIPLVMVARHFLDKLDKGVEF